ncbi:MAG: cysteine--tRNA ligase [Clostridia bacterium]|nr:cysteine--tRNA ligase [Clostridia bacterium]
MILYNTLTKKKEKFDLINKNNNKIKIYACGPTVYNFIHIGNARPICVFDVLRRYLIYKNYDVIFVQNFTDIDDKIIKRANQENTSCKEISEKYIQEYKKDAAGLNIMPATVHPKATETIDEIISIIKILVQKKYAYVSDGDVYFDITKFKNYGKLSGQSIEELESGARVEIGEKKRNALDFALWKASKPDEPYWQSPWGSGRPGWHIECSAMIKKHLGETIDIHCGGQDLIFPHHENEIAQSECANNKILARFWLHNGFININNKKMSKSLNNFFTVREIAEKYGYQPIRYLMISSHYKSPLNFSDEIIKQCQNSLERLSNFRKNLENLEKINNNNNINLNICDNIDEIRNNFIKYMDDDLNTSGALSVIFDMIKDINNKIAKQEKYSNNSIREIIKLFDDLTQVLGLKFESQNKNLTKEIEDLLAKREFYRKNKNWSEADKIRDLLKSKGYDIQDSKSSTNISIR